MTPGARIQAVIEILDTVLVAVRERGPAADHVLRKYTRSRRYIGSGDRRTISALVYDVLRDAVRLDALIEVGGANLSARQLVLAHLALKDMAALDHFNGASYAPEALSEAERAFAQSCPVNTAVIDPVAALNCPEWAAAGMQQRFGDHLPGAMEELRARAPAAFRLNLLAKTTRDEVLTKLAKDGIAARAGVYSAMAVIAEDGSTIRGHKMVSTGLLTPQDEGTQIAALLLEAAPGEQVADICAGSGGKSLGLAGLMENRGQIHAVDGSKGRLETLKKQAQRAGARNIQVYAENLGGVDGPFMRAHKSAMDRVLVDAPCTGSGTWRRNPELRLRWTSVDVKEFSRRQFDILRAASGLVKDGGVLLYVTCSLLPEENEEVVERFLRQGNAFVIEDYGDLWRRACLSSPPPANCRLKGALQLTPHPGGTDGVFIARLRKI